MPPWLLTLSPQVNMQDMIGHSYRVELEIRSPASVEGRHEGPAHVGVGEAERVAELVGGGLQQVGPLEGVDGPVLLHGARGQGFARASYCQKV